MDIPTLEPEGGYSKPHDTETLIKTESNCGKYWAVRLKHNGIEYPIPKNGLQIRINGGAVYINGSDITKRIQKGVENIFRHDSWSGTIKKITKE